MTHRRKVARFATSPSLVKKPVLPSCWPSDLESRDRISWRVGDAEVEGPWPWVALTADDALRVHAFLSEMEKLTWDEASRGGAPRIKLERLRDAPPTPRSRLEEMRRDDVDALVNLRLSGRERIWGVRRGNACHLLWWDPRHEVWPSAR